MHRSSRSHAERRAQGARRLPTIACRPGLHKIRKLLGPESKFPVQCIAPERSSVLKAGKIEAVIARLKRLRPKSPPLRESLDSLIRYYSENAGRMRYDEYLRLGYGIGSGAVESAHKQVVHARLRQAGMRWSEAGARRLLALRLLLLNDTWALLDRMQMVSVA